MFSIIAAFLIGLSISMPIGPMGGLAIWHKAHQRTYGFVAVSLGVCIADTLLAWLAFNAITLPIFVTMENQLNKLTVYPWNIVIALALITLAIILWRKEVSPLSNKPQKDINPAVKKGISFLTKTLEKLRLKTVLKLFIPFAIGFLTTFLVPTNFLAFVVAFQETNVEVLSSFAVTMLVFLGAICGWILLYTAYCFFNTNVKSFTRIVYKAFSIACFACALYILL